MLLESVIDRHACDTPEQPALSDPKTSLTWLGLKKRVEEAAGFLHAMGLNRGCRLGIALIDGVDFIALSLGAFRLGVVVVPVDWRARPAELSALVAGLELRAVVVSRRRISGPHCIGWPPEGLHAASPPSCAIGPGEPAVILLSSGTTGNPSGAVISRSAFEQRITAGGNAAFPIAGQRFLSCLPLCFSNGFTMVFRNLAAGNHVFIHPPLFTPSELIDAVRLNGATYIGLTPSIIRQLLQLSDQELAGLEGLQAVRVSGSAMSAGERREFQQRLRARLVHGYGASAFGPISHWSTDDPDASPESIGRPYEWVQFRIVDGNGEPVATGEPGLLELLGPTLATQLLTIGGDSVSLLGRWYSPGDVVKVDEDGYLYMIGRATDVIIRQGINVYPEIVESALRLHPAISEVAVVGLPADTIGEEVIACVTLKESVPTATLMAHCRSHVSSKYRPSEVRILPALPRTAAGKVKRNEVRRYLLGLAEDQ